MIVDDLSRHVASGGRVCYIVRVVLDVYVAVVSVVVVVVVMLIVYVVVVVLIMVAINVV